MKKPIIIIFALLYMVTNLPIKVNAQTYCNPLNLSYRFCLDQPSRREAADPTMVLYKDNYYLFASKSGGYWYSNDLLDWKLVTSSNLPVENYAPTAVVIGEWIYFLTSESNIIFRSNDPVSGKWEIFNDSFPLKATDPDFFADTDGRIYYYYGCSNVNPILGVELDINNKLNPIGKPVECIFGKPQDHGWERTGDYNNKPESPWIEGAWMNKFNDKYYLQYAGPGTEFKSYADGVYVADNPLGPFTYAPNNPFVSKPEGFACAAGHGSTFQDKHGNWWHIGTMTISVKHNFERRLGLFPTGFDKEGNLFSNTEFGDYPLIMPDHKVKDIKDINTGWSILSYGKMAEASTSMKEYPVTNAFDENIRTYWSAQTGNKNEWLSVDLGNLCTINAIQVNFAENNTKLFGREGILPHQYQVEYSADKLTWKIMVDKTSNHKDLTHQYDELPSPVKAQYIRITNVRVPDGTFAISDLRIFGKGTSVQPGKISSFKALRDGKDSRNMDLSWDKQQHATGYNILYGIEKDKLYHCYQVNDANAVTIRSLDKDKSYWFRIDAFGENGVTQGVVKEIK